MLSCYDSTPEAGRQRRKDLPPGGSNAIIIQSALSFFAIVWVNHMGSFVLALPLFYLYLVSSRTESKFKDGVDAKYSVRLPKLLRCILFPFSSGEVVSWGRVLPTGTFLLCAILMLIASGISYTYPDVSSQRWIFSKLYNIVGSIFFAGVFLSLNFAVAKMDHLPKVVRFLLHLVMCIVCAIFVGSAILGIIRMVV